VLCVCIIRCSLSYTTNPILLYNTHVASNSFYTELALTAQTAYAQLQDVVMARELSKGIESPNGSFSQKTLKGRSYWYFSYRDLDARVRQIYIGPASEQLDAQITNAQQRKAQDKQQDTTEALARSAAMLGCAVGLPKHVRAVRRLADYGFFKAGGVLVGTHAFVAMGNMLGVRWASGERTTDVDFAHAGRNLSVALHADVRIDVHEALTSFEAGFIPLVQLGGASGASYKLRGDDEFQIDFLTTLVRGGDKPVLIEHLNIALQPLRFMEFSLEAVEQAVLLDRNGIAVVVNIPAPARYAVHKLLIVGERSLKMRVKTNKDIQQAAALLQWLLDMQGAQAVAAIWQDAHARGKGWQERLAQGQAALERAHPALGERLRDALQTTILTS
jgi:hypothetical protein